jgi:hypothetical protein
LIFSLLFQVSRKRNSALAAGRSVGAATNFQYNLFDKIIFSKIREKLGGQLKFVLLLKFYGPMGSYRCCVRTGFWLVAVLRLVCPCSNSSKTLELPFAKATDSLKHVQYEFDCRY